MISRVLTRNMDLCTSSWGGRVVRLDRKTYLCTCVKMVIEKVIKKNDAHLQHLKSIWHKFLEYAVYI